MRDNRMTSRAGLFGLAAASMLALTACGTDEIEVDELQAIVEESITTADEVSCDGPLALDDGASVDCNFVQAGRDVSVPAVYSEEDHAIELEGDSGRGDITVELDDENTAIVDEEGEAQQQDSDEDPAQEPAQEEEPAVDPTEDPAQADETEEPAVDPLEL